MGLPFYVAKGKYFFRMCNENLACRRPNRRRFRDTSQRGSPLKRRQASHPHWFGRS